MRRVIVLRPEPGASETVARARRLGLDAVAIPLFAIEPLPWTAPADSFDGLLLTSANAVRVAGDGLAALRDLPVYAVGEATAAAAAGAGLQVAAAGSSGVDALLASIEPELRLLHLCGEDRAMATGASQTITAVPIYRAAPLDRPDFPALADTVVLIHSPRAGRRLAELAADRGTTMIAAISEAAAVAAGAGWKRIAVADQPSDQALLALAARLCNNTGA
jgi:uroporphyrinogen-III synthase